MVQDRALDRAPKLVKISKSEYDALLEARALLLRQGYQALPAPVVERAMRAGLGQGRAEGFTRGAVISLSVAALLHLLSDDRVLQSAGALPYCR